ncbi:MAG: hypothetical protein QFX35_00405 [Candidatus Verstraetearchaeota archaeon]|nr:hypothetical protein [Candidatus Verstraetearchaeota archaeon]
MYEDPELVSPKEVLDKNNGRCPKCSSPLKFDQARLRISISEENKKGLFRLFQKGL